MRVKAVTLLFCLGVVVGALQNAQAQTVLYAGAGSSAMWQSFALAAFNGGSCVSGGTKPCFHYTAKNFLLHDNRPSPAGGNAIADEPGNIWVVWDSAATPNVWMYINVDSVVGNRCYFGAATNFPHTCTFTQPTTGIGAPAGLIDPALWGADTALPTSIANLFTVVSKNPVTTAAMTDVRPEDAMYANCRSNSELDASNTKKGLGYNTHIPAGECAKFGFTPADLVGSQILSSFSTKFAQTVPFSIVGGTKDPITGLTVTTGTVVKVGAQPIVFLYSRLHNLAGQKLSLSDTNLQGLYTGNNASGKPDPNAKQLGLAASGLNVLQREPLSGTMNTTEFNVFRNNPFQTDFSQEDDVNPPADNPLKQSIDGGGRFRVIGTGEMVAEIKAIGAPGNTSLDTFGYAFFSFGNVSSIADSTSYAYAQLDGLNPIFTQTGGDPGDPGNQELPSAANCPGGHLPCPESTFWKGGKSFPNLRACTATGNAGYRAWSIVRLISDNLTGNKNNLTNANKLVAGAQSAVVNSVPDFVSNKELSCYRAHYTFQVTNTDGTKTTINPNDVSDAGRDEGGCIFSTAHPNVINLGQEYAQNGVPKPCAAVQFP